jgi:hypothetical protein
VSKAGKESPEIAERLMTPAAVRMRGGRVVLPAEEVGVANPPAPMTRSSVGRCSAAARGKAVAQVKDRRFVATSMRQLLQKPANGRAGWKARRAPADIPGTGIL